MRVLLSALLVAGCGRFGFETTSGKNGEGAEGVDAVDGSAGGGDDAMEELPDSIGPATGCTQLPTTCGPSGTMSCCDSPMVSGGTFLRGYDQATDSMYSDTTRPAMLGTFRLDRYEVTVRRFRQFVLAGKGTQADPPATNAGARDLNGMANQGGWSSTWNASLAPDTTALMAALACDSAYQTWTDTPGNNENHPITCVSWFEAMAFCAWDGGFLPTEAEWHYAASGGSLGRAYAWSSPASSTAIDCGVANYGGPDWPTTACVAEGARPVGSTSPSGDGVWGHADLGGNAWEWVLDGYGATYQMPCSDCARLGPAPYRMLRGGSFGRDATLLRAANRSFLQPEIRYGDGGVRCARTP